MPFEPVALVLQAAANPVDDVLDDRFDRERQELRRAPGDPAAAGLVARELRLVDEQDARTRGCEVIARKGSCGAGTDDRDVAVHRGMLTLWLPRDDLAHGWIGVTRTNQG